jgi:polysaccharide biosynthesis protein PslG
MTASLPDMPLKAGQHSRGAMALAISRRRIAGVVAGCALLCAVSAIAIAGRASAGLPSSYYGVVPQTALSGGDFQQMAGGGVGSVRIRVNWARIQPSQNGGFNWAAVDGDVQGAFANGIRPLLNLIGSPDWATGCHKKRCDTVAPVGSKKARRAWKRFCAAAANRYGQGGILGGDAVNDYQIWNEENSPTRYKPKPSPSGYARLLKIASKAIHDRDSNARIVLGGMFGTPDRPQAIYAWRFLKRLYKRNGIERFFDAVALHPYSPNIEGIKLQLQLGRRALKQAGDAGTPIWITEIGWGSNHASDRLSKGPKGQARMLKKSFRLFRHKRHSWGIQRVFWYAWKDAKHGAICSWCWAAGLVEKDGSGKPAWHAYRRLAQ